MRCLCCSHPPRLSRCLQHTRCTAAAVRVAFYSAECTQQRGGHCVLVSPESLPDDIWLNLSSASERVVEVEWPDVRLGRNECERCCC